MIVEILNSDPAWPALFSSEKSRLQQLLGPLAPHIEHIGSTSVPGLAAKPVIDIQVGVPSLEEFLQADGIQIMRDAGYEYQPRFEELVPFRRLFTREENGTRLNNLHLVPADHPWLQRHIYFRNYLRQVPEARNRYESVKKQLIQREWNEMTDYAIAKNDIIKSLEEEAYAHFDLDDKTRTWLRDSRV